MQIVYQEITSELLEKICSHFGDEKTIRSHIHFEEGSYSLASLHDGVPVGFISTYTQNFTAPLFSDACAYINIIEVDEKYQRQGIAKNLIDLTEKWAKKTGFSQISAWSSHHSCEAILMWRKLQYCMCPAKIWLEWCKTAVDGYYVTKRLNPTAALDNKFFLNHWYADIYEQKETGTDEAEFVLSILKEKEYNVNNILEVACGGGRNTIPLAKAGYNVTGFDFDEYMLEKLQKRVENENIRNISWRKADALKDDWGKGFDVVVLAGNIFINIVAEGDYAEAQELFIKKAADCVKPGGYMYLDFDCSVYYHKKEEDSWIQSSWVCFEGTDDIGTYGKYIVGPGNSQRYEITPKNGGTFTEESACVKHFPTYAETKKWLDKYGWEILQLYGSRSKTPFDENTEGNRAVIWAKKFKQK